LPSFNDESRIATITVVLSELDRKVIGRTWLTIALDVATRRVLSFYVGMERPGATTVGLLLTRAALFAPREATGNRLELA
jgi:hypothetical protein